MWTLAKYTSHRFQILTFDNQRNWGSERSGKVQEYSVLESIECRSNLLDSRDLGSGMCLNQSSLFGEGTSSQVSKELHNISLAFNQDRVGKYKQV